MLRVSARSDDTTRAIRPTNTGSVVKLIGNGYRINLLSSERLYLVEVDTDQWKSWAHARLSTPVDGRGALSLFEAAPQEHLALAKHLTAERKVEEFVAGKGYRHSLGTHPAAEPLVRLPVSGERRGAPVRHPVDRRAAA